MNENIDNDLLHQRWHIDLEWYEKNSCSFFTLAKSSLCLSCRKQLRSETEASEVLERIAVCCSRKDSFITRNTSILAGVFRIFLMSHNQPFTLEEIAGELARCRGDKIGVSSEVLYRILMSDRYYGLQPAHEEVKQ